jgi:CubicO group peptidase (beta-lactamase class C family)
MMWILYAIGALVGLIVLFVAYTTIQFARLPDPAAASSESPGTAEEQLEGKRNLNEFLEPIRRQYKLPALAAAAVKDGRIAALGAVGVRRASGNERVNLYDCFHIGSCTKSMTATLCAILVQQGKLKWDSTIGEVFADQKNKIASEFHGVTLAQLLMHRSGLPEDRSPDRKLWPKIWGLSGPMLEQRRAFVELVLAEKPTVAPGSKHQYSNSGYTVAGAMCERVTGKAWEDLMREQLFAPLEMRTAGFGPPGTADEVDQPWGHLVRGATWKPIPPGRDADNPAVISPAGTVHCSLADWAKYAAFHLRGARGEEKLLPAAVFEKLHTPLPDDDKAYAYGWLVTEREWAGGKALTHAGSNTMWFAVVWITPKRDAAYLAATNVGHDTAFTACDATIGKLIE